jgi:S-formylglutathione hydrolase
MADGWSTEGIDGKAADVYDPPAVRRPTFALLFLHGYGLETLADREAFGNPIAKLGMACVCPHGHHSWWADRVCEEFDKAISPERFLLDSVVPFIQKRWSIETPLIGLHGISMGGQGALRLAFKHPARFPVAAAISPAVEYHQLYGHGSTLDAMYTNKEHCRQDTVPMHISPASYPAHVFFCTDPEDVHWWRGGDRLVEKLNALGIPHEADLTTRAGGHTWDYFNFMAERSVRFVYEGLVQVSRRLL